MSNEDNSLEFFANYSNADTTELFLLVPSQ